ncbi:hypothetical protein [Pedobacter montanisoli]|uniref:Carboxypeptidase-like regulatory domain-containing protein n=1 Tax=Pedobacter montanisoli TaxID=2923277 RepID=A0ABS9ZTP5_9SPHI|nr:hypothetical protein [Pedobacter montanisoli]MCJ0741970.1 hypothetical protein [Pedobacter montanisoli]
MYKYATSFLFLLIFTIKAAFAQEEFVVNGAIFEAGSKIRIALAEIKNKRTGFSIGSNDMGIFSLKAALGDTLEITKRGFNDAVVVVSSKKDIILNLNRGNLLNEVVIKGQSKAKELEEMKQEFRNKGSFYNGKPPLSLLNPFGGSPLTFLYELLGKTPRQARRFSRLYNSEIQQNQIDLIYNKSVINKYTGLTDKELEDFMVKYRPEYEQAKHWNQYDAIKWINTCFKQYKEEKGIK